MNPKISIVMPVYIVEKYLRECLDSVRAQTFTDWECICVDDGSTDGSVAILDEYAAKDSRFRVVRREHSNAGACRNAGLDLSQGEYLSFLDSDDVFAPKMLENLSKALNDTEADIATCGHKDFHNGEEQRNLFRRNVVKSIKRIKTPALTNDIFKCWVSWAWDKMFRRDFIDGKKIRFQCIDSWNDMFFVDAALSFAKEVVILDACYIGHRKHSTSIMATSTRKLCFAQALTEYYNSILVGQSLIHNANLVHSFYRAVFRNARFMLNSAHDGEDFSVLYQALQALMDSLPVRNLQESVFGDDYSLLKFYQRVCQLKTPCLFLFCENKHLRQVPDLRNSISYRFGRVMTLIPRLLKNSIK